MQLMLNICDEFASDFDIVFNSKKSFVIRIGYRYNVKCENLTLAGALLVQAKKCKYLGVNILCHSKFKCEFDGSKTNFYKTFNCILSKCHSQDSELILVHLLKTTCTPLLLYCIEVMPFKASDFKSLDNCINVAVMKIFNVQSAVNVNNIRHIFNLNSIESVAYNRL